MKVSDIRNAELMYCRDNIEYFIDTYGHIEDKDNPESIIQRFEMWPMQREALKSISEHKLNVILKARQLGFSWLVLHYSAHLMLTMGGRTVIGLSQKEDDAKELVRKLEVIFQNMPSLVQEKSKAPAGWDGPVYEKFALEIRIHFPNGIDSKFTGMPSSPGAGRSWTANLIILDEWAFQQFAEEIYTSGFPTVNRPTGGQVIGLSTIDRGSFFEEIFTNPDNGFNKIFIPWYADPRRTDEWYENTKKAMGDMISQEYPATVEEALMVPGGSFFPEVKSDIHITEKRIDGNLNTYVAFDYGLDMLSVHWFHVNSKGRAQIYKELELSDMTISQAANMILNMSRNENVLLYLAPPDLWNRSQESGRSRAQLFAESGLYLTKVSNDFAAGCAAMKDYLRVQDDGEPLLTIMKDTAPGLWRSLTKIQKDKKRPNVYAKEPHNLTHACDSLRYFCVYWITPASVTGKSGERRKWTYDMWEDYENANDSDKAYLIERWGEPV